METSAHPPVDRAKQAAMSSLTVVGFVALIIAGILAAIYAANFIPKALTGLSTANVYLSNLSQPQLETPSQTPTATQNVATSVPLSTAPTSPTNSVPTTPVVVTPQPIVPTYGVPTYNVVQVPSIPNYYGLPDLTVTITDSGYLRDSNTSSFVSSSHVPDGDHGAVRYTIANRGTNVSGTYRVEINVHTDGGTDTDSIYGPSLPAGSSVVGTGVFDANNSGDATIRITVDSDNSVHESNENNNDDSSTIHVDGHDGSSHNTDNYDSNGNYCSYGTYYSNGHYYCDSSDHSNHSNNNTDNYDSNGNYCSYGTYYSNGHYYCSDNSSYYTRDQTCTNGGYYQNSTYYCY